MPIAALPPSTAQAIGSTSILPDPCAVIKELVDNGLDAGASSISVEISQNTVDVIKVKDNGHGIGPVDFDCVCKRAYTSKIHTLDDLQQLGGRSLGFRGVALASAADMCETITITTRTKDEIVASVLKYDAKGQLVSTEKASHAVGTTVCLTGFLKTIPVRRQTAVKSCSKSISKLRNVLQAYAMARPGTRLSLTVLNNKHEKDNWTYAPSSAANIADASRKVVGVEIAGQCVCRSWPENHDGEPDTQIRLLAYLPKTDADFSKIGNSGQYISVDGRPLSSTRGTSKEFIRLYKSYIQSAARAKGVTGLSEPFLCVEISCPKNSYDVNVEPAKDDVLFAERDELITLAKGLFEATYGELKKNCESTDKPAVSVQSFDLLLRQPAPEGPVSAPSASQLPNITQTPVPSDGTSKTSLTNIYMSAQEGESTSDTGIDDSAEPGDNGISPWSIAKTHFFKRTSPSNRKTQVLTPSRQHLMRPMTGSRAEAHQSSAFDIPSPSSHLSSSEDSSTLFNRSSSLVSVNRNFGSNRYRKASRERDKERYGNGSLDTWFTKSVGPIVSNSLHIEQPDDQLETESVMLDDLDTDELADQTCMTVTKSFISTLSQEARGSFGNPQRNVPSSRIDSINCHSMKRQEFPVMENWTRRIHEVSRVPEDTQPETSTSQQTELALDFERRKREANLIHRKNVQDRQLYLGTPASTQSTSNFPHKNRFLAAKAALSQHSQQDQPRLLRPSNQPPSADHVSMKPNDPRTLLMRHQSEQHIELAASQPDNGTKKSFWRIPTNRLPLEKIPNGFDIHNLGLDLDVSISLGTHCKRVADVDFYVSGKDEAGHHAFSIIHNPDLVEVCKTWEAVIESLIKRKYRRKEVDLYNAAGGSYEGLLENIDVYAAMNAM